MVWCGVVWCDDVVVVKKSKKKKGGEELSYNYKLKKKVMMTQKIKKCYIQHNFNLVLNFVGQKYKEGVEKKKKKESSITFQPQNRKPESWLR